MLFVTNRVLNQSKKLKKGREVSFKLNDNTAEQSIYFCQRLVHNGKVSYYEIGGHAWMAELKNDPANQLLFYIHGYSNLPEEDIFPRAALLQKAFEQVQPGEVKVVPIIWPCDNDLGIVKDYYDDQKAADASNIAFARALEMFMDWREENRDTPCLKRVNVLAHSMGNRVLREAVYAWAKYDRNWTLPMIFRNVFLIAADIVNESLESDKRGYYLTHMARNVSVYYAADDMALISSKVVNLRNRVASRRLGHTGPEDMSKVPANVFAIDCDYVNTEYDHPKGHSYFLFDGKGEGKENQGRIFRHLCHSVLTGRVLCNEGDRNHVIARQPYNPDFDDIY